MVWRHKFTRVRSGAPTGIRSSTSSFRITGSGPRASFSTEFLSHPPRRHVVRLDEGKKRGRASSHSSPSPAIRNGFSFVSTDDDSDVRHCRYIYHVNTGCRDIRRAAHRVGDPSSHLSHRADAPSTPCAHVADDGATRRNRRSDNTLPPDAL